MHRLSFSKRDPEELYQGLITILESTYNGIIVVDKDGVVVFFNKAAERMLGKSAQEVVGKHILDNLSNSGLIEVMETGKPQVGQKLLLNGLTCITNRTPIIRDGAIIGAVGVFQDISDLDHISRELTAVKNLSQELDAIIESSYDGIYVTDGQGNTTRVNKAYERITGVMGTEVIGRNMRDLVREGFYNQSVTLLVLERKKPVTIMQEIKKTGKYVIVTGNPIFNQAGEIICVVTNVRDITELNNLKSQLETTKNLSERYLSELQHLRSMLYPDDIVAVSPEMKSILQKVRRISLVDSTVLIMGESGVGKEVIARLIHKNSPRAEKPFIAINCGALPENLLESELFGYEGGAFTGAKKGGKPGLVELANGGTLFLDEIGELTLAMQVKLLRLLQEKRFIRVGGSQVQQVDVRFITATNQDLKVMVKENRFREDLYYRLNVVPIYIPPLRERTGDLLPLINRFLKHFSERYGQNKKISREALELLMAYPWPGNIRELENTIEQLFVLSPGEEITVLDIPDYIRDRLPQYTDQVRSLDDMVAKFEKDIITKALSKHKHMEKAAAALGIHRTTLLRKLRKYDLQLYKELSCVNSD